jgi:hypothetical protein
VLAVLFLIQFAIPSSEVRLAIAWIYIGLALLLVVVRRPALTQLWQTVREVAAEYRARA